MTNRGMKKERYVPPQVPSRRLPARPPPRSGFIPPQIWFNVSVQHYRARVMKNDPPRLQGEPFGKSVWSVCVCAPLLLQRESCHCKCIECPTFVRLASGRARISWLGGWKTLNNITWSIMRRSRTRGPESFFSFGVWIILQKLVLCITVL